ncbi:MAG TPA: glycosyltransferase family 1 protein [Acidimicrobiales bacterium]|nr:glycosyltransferase family 1 protein [Acidimicrobiales bacterium]
MPTVALDTTPLLGQRTGIGVAVAGFVQHLAGRPGLDLVGYGLTARGWRSVAANLPPGFRCRPRPAPAGLLLDAWSRWDWPPAEWWAGPADLVHGTNFVVPPARRARRLVSVWDLTAVHRPELCTPVSRRYPHLVARAVAGGAWVHTGSHHVAAEIAGHFGADPARILVVPPGVEVPAGAAGRPGPGGGGPPYVLALGRTEPRKDLPTLVRGFDLVAEAHPDLELRIAGPPGWAEEGVAAAISASPFAGRIRRMGWVDDAPSLIAGAAVFAYPSVYEGFGLPPLEAMALGVPVVATSVGSVPEIVGDAAELVAPGDPQALAGGLDRVLADADRRQRLVRAGYARAGQFSWPAAAEGMARAYLEVLSGGA